MAWLLILFIDSALRLYKMLPPAVHERHCKASTFEKQLKALLIEKCPFYEFLTKLFDDC